MRKVLLLLIAFMIPQILLSSCSNAHSENEQTVIGWIPENSYFVDYQINQDKIKIGYSVCLFNKTSDPVDISISFRFQKKDLKGWLNYASFYDGLDDKGERMYATIAPMEKKNIVFYFEGTYLGGTVNEKLFPDEIMMVVKDTEINES